MDRGTLIRSYTAGDLGFILHSRHQYQWHTGYAPPQTVAAPHLGAVIARTLGPLNPAVPPFINIGQRFDVGEGEELKAFTTAGFLGSEYRPVQHSVSRPSRRRRAPARRHDAGPLRESRHVLQASCSTPARSASTAATIRRIRCCVAYDNAHRLLSSPAAKAFDLSLEPLEHVRKYVPGLRPGAAVPCRAGSLRRQVRAADGRPLRPGLPAGAAAGRSRRALHRGHHRIHPVPELGHARERPQRRPPT